MSKQPVGRSKSATECIFCKDKRLTKEHVFSKWTHKHMMPRRKGRALSTTGIEYVDRSETAAVKLPGQVRDWKVKCVCGGPSDTCNNGWMRKLDELAEPIMTPLIRGNATRLSPRDLEIIATWASLKVMVAEYDTGDYVTVHHTQRKRMWKRQLPPLSNWGVWIGHYERRDWLGEWMARPFYLAPSRHTKLPLDRKVTHYNSNTTTQVVGKLFIQVMHTPMPNAIERWRFALPRDQTLHGRLFRIWPVGTTSLKWGPPRALTDDDAARVANAMAVFFKQIAAQARSSAA